MTDHRTAPGRAPGRGGATAGRREWAALAVLVLAVVLLAIDGTVLSLAVPALAADLQPSASQLLWIGDSYSLALAGLLVTMGSLGDRIGRRRLLLLGAAGFGAASLLAAFAQSAEWLIVARVLLGVGGATLMPSTLSIIRNVFTDQRQRTRAIAIWGAAATAGAAVGPLVGGGLLQHFWWGSVFLVNVPVMVVLVVLGLVLIPESRDPHPGPFDLASAALSVVGLVGLVLAVKEGIKYGVTPTVGIAVVTGVTALTLFVDRQNRLPAPLIDVSLFRRPAFAGAVTVNLLSVFALSGLVFFLSQHFQLVRGWEPLEAGMRQLPLTLASVAVIGLVGLLVARVGRGHLIGAAMATSAAGLGLLAAVVAGEGYDGTAVALALVGLGVGLSLTLTTDAVVSAVPPAKAGAASAISETAYELGIALGIAFLGALHTVLYRNTLRLPTDTPGALAERIEDSLAAGSATADEAPGAEQALAAAQQAFTDAVQATSAVAAVVVLVAAGVAWRVIPSSTDAAAVGTASAAPDARTRG